MNMELKERIGKKIKQLRVERKMTQSELAELVGIQAKTQSCIETGRNFPSASVLEKYAHVFKIDVAEVLQIGDIEKSENNYRKALHKIIERASDKQIEYIYKHAKLVVES